MSIDIFQKSEVLVVVGGLDTNKTAVPNCLYFDFPDSEAKEMPSFKSKSTFALTRELANNSFYSRGVVFVIRHNSALVAPAVGNFPFQPYGQGCSTGILSTLYQIYSMTHPKISGAWIVCLHLSSTQLSKTTCVKLEITIK